MRIKVASSAHSTSAVYNLLPHAAFLARQSDYAATKHPTPTFQERRCYLWSLTCFRQRCAPLASHPADAMLRMPMRRITSPSASCNGTGAFSTSLSAALAPRCTACTRIAPGEEPLRCRGCPPISSPSRPGTGRSLSLPPPRMFTAKPLPLAL